MVDYGELIYINDKSREDEAYKYFVSKELEFHINKFKYWNKKYENYLKLKKLKEMSNSLKKMLIKDEEKK